MTDAERWLRGAPIFAGAEQTDLHALAAYTAERTYAPGDVVVAAGEPGYGLIVITEGRVSMDQQLETGEGPGVQVVFGPGDTLGELNAIDGAPHERSATARAPTRVLFLPREALLATMRERPSLGVAIAATLADWVRQADRRAAEMALRGRGATPFAFRRLYPAPGEAPESPEETRR